jgi:hypothetical protein
MSSAGGLVFFVPGIKGERLRSCSVGCANSLLIEGNSRPSRGHLDAALADSLSPLSMCLCRRVRRRPGSLALNQGSTAREWGGGAWLCQMRFENWRPTEPTRGMRPRELAVRCSGGLEMVKVQK